MADNQSLNDAQNALNDFANHGAKDAANMIAHSFHIAGKDIANALADAAKSGELSFKKLISTILRDLSSMAIRQNVTKPIENVLTQIFSTIPKYGARASGGAVNSGGAYLVGENGPEYFVPNQAGSIETGIGGAVHIHINMAQGSNLNDVKKSANQVSMALARADERGRGRL